jgi:hypothetical protein
MNMRSSAILLTAGLGLLMPGVARPQPPSPVEDRSGNTPATVAHALSLIGARQNAEEQEAAGRAAELRMYEDIEIMRRILDRGLRRYAATSMARSEQAGDAVRWTSGEFDSLRFDGDGFPDILLTEAGGLHPIQQADARAVRAWFMPQDAHHRGSEWEGVDGVYLKGYGVHFTTSLAAQLEQLNVPVAKPVKNPLSQWERTRQELRGVPMAAEEKSAPSPQVTLADRLLKVLADNGQHFSQLPEEERLTITVTLRKAEGCVSCHSMPGAGGMAGRGAMSGMMGGGMPGPGSGPTMGGGGGMAMMSGMMGAGGVGGKGGAGMGVMMSGAQSAEKPRASKIGAGGATDAAAALLQSIYHGGKEGEALQAEAENNTLLGDLHLKQERPKDALAAYQKAISTYQKALKPGNAAQGDPAVRSYLVWIDLYNKLARAARAAGDQASALDAYQRIAEYSRRLEAAAQKKKPEAAQAAGTTAETPAVPLPPKLIVSAPKKVLDLVGAGKVTFEEFKKSATVQLLTFPNPPSNAPAAGAGGKPAGSTSSYTP